MDVEKTTRIAVKRRLVSLERDFASFTDYRGKSAEVFAIQNI